MIWAHGCDHPHSWRWRQTRAFCCPKLCFSTEYPFFNAIDQFLLLSLVGNRHESGTQISTLPAQTCPNLRALVCPQNLTVQPTFLRMVKKTPGNHQEQKIKAIMAKPAQHCHKPNVTRSTCDPTHLAQNKLSKPTTFHWTACSSHRHHRAIPWCASTSGFE